MKPTKSVLAAALTAAIGLGVAGQASAGIYAGSAQTFENLVITISPIANATITNFNFNSTNTAQLNNGAVDATGGNCGGLPGPPSGITNNCGTAPNVLAPGAANAAGSTVIRADNDYTTRFGPGGQQYANSNSRIEQAELVDFLPTRGQAIAEAEIQGGTSAASNAELSSITGFNFTFTLANPGSLSISFDGSKYLLADINDPTAITASARASFETRFTLEQINGGSGFWQWKPNGNNGCITLGLSCVGVSEAFNANDSAQTTTLPVSTSDHSYLGGSTLGNFTAGTGNTLSAGTWSLTLFNKVSTVVSRTVPEPSTVFLLGAGLAGLGFGRYRRKRS